MKRPTLLQDLVKVVGHMIEKATSGSAWRLSQLVSLGNPTSSERGSGQDFAQPCCFAVDMVA